MNQSENINELAQALAKAQAEMGGVLEDANNPFFKSKYADLSSIIKVIKPPFAENGLSYSQFPITSEDRIGVETIIMHKSGQFISNEFTMNVPKADPQSAGGVISYCRRYALQAVMGIPAVDSDAEDFMQVIREEEQVKKEEKKKAPVNGAKVVDNNWQDYVLTTKKGTGKHEGKTMGEVSKSDPSYIRWMAGLEDIKSDGLKNALNDALKEMDGNGKQGFKKVG